ncbi:MAG: CDP-glucose 4,6-dehydratase [Fibrobacteres bacterium]|nr:CDP-glucose 4,6-dehydratase [Fibrobacterota bacterium]
MNSLESFYRGRRVMVTGHTGFKGAWLSRWLELLGAEVTGYALAPDNQPNLHQILQPRFPQTIADIRSRTDLDDHLAKHRPEMVFHLAAQPLVGRSHREPAETFDTNVRGTWTLLDALRESPSTCAVVVVTTDKCYRNPEDGVPFREDSPLGGADPYSASKACCEIVCGSWRDSFWSTPESPLLATARSGNVVGGGDWSEDRIVPDAVKSEQSGQPMRIRHPEAVRPWQHVLEPLRGYLLLGARLLSGFRSAATAWNFGPTPDQVATVRDVLASWQRMRPSLNVIESPVPTFPESVRLLLDSSRSREHLEWSTLWNLERTLLETERWYTAFDRDGKCLCDEQIESYQAQFLRQLRDVA